MSKLSLHISDWLDPDIAYDFIGATRPPIVKVFGNVGLNDTKIAEAKQRSPGTTFVGRVYFPEQGIERDEREPQDTVFNYNAVADAQNAFNQMREIVEKLRGLVTIWEAYNEIPIDTPAPLTEREFQKARNYNAFTVEMARLMHSIDLKYAAYSFSTGNPVHVELWDLLVDGLRASDFLALHEYIAPNQDWTEFNLTMCNRYREAYARIPADARKPIVITECGADFNGEHGFQEKISVPQYLDMMSRYDKELMRDPYVIGATIFCYGIDDKRWRTYDIGGNFSGVLREYIAATPTPPLEVAAVISTPVAPTPAIIAPVAEPHPTGLLLLVEAFALAKQARDQLQAGDGKSARAILKDTLVPWFYASAPQHSSDLANAQAHTEARWYCEQAVRQIEAENNGKAIDAIDKHVLVWLASPGPRALGLLSVSVKTKKKAAAKKPQPKKAIVKKTNAKKPSPKKSPGLLSAPAKPAKKKSSTPKIK